MSDKLDDLERKNKALIDALREYADPINWSQEAEIEYETGEYNGVGDPISKYDTVLLDLYQVWCGSGDNGYELAQEVLRGIGHES